ncbi:DUF4164 domain-containing protein [Candidatus Pacearchaeota archaeon]|jgi:phage-related protein|nr:DUF4164 domain-containing protein [Candidatus Pacearchaeota archaeon]
MATPVLDYRIRSKDESKAGIDSAKANAEGLTGKMKDLTKGMEGVNKLASTMMGAGALAGVTMALLKVYQGAAECEDAFIKLNPEMAKTPGSAANFQRAVDSLKASIGGAIATALDPFRSFFIDLISPTDLATKKLVEFGREFDALMIKYASTEQLTEIKRTKDLAEATETLTAKQNDLADARAKVSALSASEAAKGQLAYEASQAYTKSGNQPSYLYPMQMAQGAYDEARKLSAANTEIIQRTESAIETIQNFINRNSTAVAGGVSGTSRSGVAGETVDGTDQGWMGYAGGGPEYQIESLLTGIGDSIQEGLEDFAGGTSAGSQGYQSQGTQDLSRIIGIISSVGSSLLSLITSIDTVRIIMDPLGVILRSFVATLEPTIDSLLTPLIGALSIIGQTLGAFIMPILEAFGPVIRYLCDLFASAYNFLLPVFNAIIFVFDGIGKAIRAAILPFQLLGTILVWSSKVVNDWVYNTFQKGILDKSRDTAGDLAAQLAAVIAAATAAATATPTYLEPIDFGDLTASGEQYVANTGGSTSTAGTATYHATTINVAVNAQGAYISDLRDFALLIRDEIKAAEAINN